MEREIEFLEEQIREHLRVDRERCERKMYLVSRLIKARSLKKLSDERILKLCHTGE